MPGLRGGPAIGKETLRRFAGRPSRPAAGLPRSQGLLNRDTGTIARSRAAAVPTAAARRSFDDRSMLREYFDIAGLLIAAGWVVLFCLVVLTRRPAPPAPPPGRLPRVALRRCATARGGYAEQQLRAVEAATFRSVPLLNRPEYRTFKIIEDLVAESRRGYRVFAQASLGEILKSSEDSAHRSINSKRVDILIVDHGGWPLAAIEYQGSGHYQGDAICRDAIKEKALRKAGVHYIAIFPTDSPAQIRARVCRRLGWKTAGPAAAATGLGTLPPGPGPWRTAETQNHAGPPAK